MVNDLVGTDKSAPPGRIGQGRFFPRVPKPLSPLVLATVSLAIALLGCWSLPLSASEGGGLRPRPELLVTAIWLQDNLPRRNVLAVDLRSIGDYRKGHIPGAVHLPITSLLTRQRGLSGMMPPLAKVESALRNVGIGAETIVVGYDASNGLLAARLFWTLDYLGQGNGRLLDGGWPGWTKESRPVSKKIPEIGPGTFVARPQPGKIADMQWMKDRIGDEKTIFLDARSKAEYLGLVRYAKRGGHIPGALLYNWKWHFDEKRLGYMKPFSELAGAYRELGLSEEREIAVYCQVMMRASHSYFVLKWLGYPQVRGYDGSWEEWGNELDMPVEAEHIWALPLGN